MIRFFTPATKQAVKQTIAQAAPIVERVTHIGASVVTIYTGYTILSQNRRQPAHPQVDQP